MALENGQQDIKPRARVGPDGVLVPAPARTETAAANNETGPKEAPLVSEVERRMSDVGTVEINQGGQWRSLSEEEVDRYLAQDEWERLHPDEAYVPPDGGPRYVSSRDVGVQEQSGPGFLGANPSKVSDAQKEMDEAIAATAAAQKAPEAPVTPPQTPPEPPTREEVPTRSGTGDEGDMKAHESIEAHDDTEHHDVLHEFQRRPRGGERGAAAPASEQQPAQPPQVPEQQQQQPPAEPLLDPQFFRPSALNRGTFTHRDRPNETFTLDQVTQETQRFAQQGQPQAPTQPQQPQNPDQQRGRETEPTPEELARRLEERNERERAGRAGGIPDPHLVIAERVHERRGRRTDSYEIDERLYAGINIKKIRTEILPNERDAQLFGELLRAINPNKEDALQRYKDGNPTKEDMDFLTYGAYEFSRSLRMGEDANKLWSKSDTELLSRRNRDMMNLLVHEDEPRATEIVKSTMLHMAMRDPDAVEDMLDALKQLKTDQNTYRYRKASDKILTLAQRRNLDIKGFTAIMDPKDKRASIAQMAERIHENAGKARRAIDWVSGKVGLDLYGSSRDSAIRDMIETERAMTGELGFTKRLLGRVDENLDALASYLGPSVGNAEARSLISQETIENQNKLLASEGGPRTFGQLQNSTKQRETVVKSRIQALVDDPNFRAQPIEVQNTRLAGLKSTVQEEERRKGWGGFFAWLFSIGLGKQFDDTASSALGRPVHV